MDNKMYQDEFEQFLQDEVKQHRMYPSDHIWKNIRTEIHGYTAWPALTFISLFIITALTISTLLINHPNTHIVKVSGNTHINQTPFHPSNYSVASSITIGDYFHHNIPEQITTETFYSNAEASITQEPVLHNAIHAFTEKTASTTTVDPYLASNPVIPVQTTIQNTLVASTNQEYASNLLPTNADYTETNSIGTLPVTQQIKATDSHASADDFLKEFAPVVFGVSEKKNSKFGFQFYITPSTSYRKLTDQKVKEIIQPATAASASPSQNIPLSPNYAADVNNVVRHKPAMGLEIGFAVLYNISNRLKFKTGAQVNIRQYYIETFQSTNDLSSLSLINNRGIETISFYSPYNNNTGYKKTQLDNKVYQVSVPIGIQWEMIMGKHFGISTEASVQPTLTLNNNTYLLSTDYQHYANGNNLLRKWNINSSVGINFTYKFGSTTWQLGPQLRYQHLPTYSNVYPIKEYLMDYGVRLGFTKQIN